MVLTSVKVLFQELSSSKEIFFNVQISFHFKLWLPSTSIAAILNMTCVLNYRRQPSVWTFGPSNFDLNINSPKKEEQSGLLKTPQMGQTCGSLGHNLLHNEEQCYMWAETAPIISGFIAISVKQPMWIFLQICNLWDDGLSNDLNLIRGSNEGAVKIIIDMPMYK